MNKLTHLDEQGAARMVDVSAKDATDREAVAEAAITLSADALEAVMSGTAKKGDVLAAARIAGIMAAKKTSELIPLCHPIGLSRANIDFETDPERSVIRIVASTKTTGQTGVEMEALTAASIAALTIYDMIKAVDRAAVIGDIRLVSKSGGKSGNFAAPGAAYRKFHAMGERTAARPTTLVGVVAAPPSNRADANRDTAAQREAFRLFMTSRHLRATKWARDAGVPAAHIYAFLTGKARTIPTETAERLALVARTRVENMFK